MRPSRPERAASVLVVPVVMTLALGVAVGAAKLGTGAASRAKADAVADVVALAAVVAPGEGSAVAAANGAVLHHHGILGDVDVVEVLYDGVVARAAASAG